jgi:hypothetical protein
MRETPLLDVRNPTQQQIFDVVVAHARQMPGKCQGVIETESGPMPGACDYRGPNGNACWIGALLTDEEAAPLDVRQNSSFASIRAEAPDLIPERFRAWELRHFMGSIQGIHDSVPIEQWPHQLRELARANELDASSVDQHFGA